MSNSINLVGSPASQLSPIKVVYNIDPNAGTTTITLQNATGTSTYGSIVIETNRHRPLLEALVAAARNYSPNEDSTVLGHRLLLDAANYVAKVYIG